MADVEFTRFVQALDAIVRDYPITTETAGLRKLICDAVQNPAAGYTVTHREVGNDNEVRGDIEIIGTDKTQGFRVRNIVTGVDQNISIDPLSTSNHSSSRYGLRITLPGDQGQTPFIEEAERRHAFKRSKGRRKAGVNPHYTRRIPYLSIAKFTQVVEFVTPADRRVVSPRMNATVQSSQDTLAASQAPSPNLQQPPVSHFSGVTSYVSRPPDDNGGMDAAYGYDWDARESGRDFRRGSRN